MGSVLFVFAWYFYISYILQMSPVYVVKHLLDDVLHDKVLVDCQLGVHRLGDEHRKYSASWLRYWDINDDIVKALISWWPCGEERHGETIFAIAEHHSVDFWANKSTFCHKKYFDEWILYPSVKFINVMIFRLGLL